MLSLAGQLGPVATLLSEGMIISESARAANPVQTGGRRTLPEPVA
jgi:hypothetical protein